MEILRIGKHAIKISLSHDESKEYKLQSSDNLNENEGKEAFLRLLNDAKNLVDFSYSGRKIFTEIYPSKDGGCEVFISTVSADTKYKSPEYTKSQKQIVQRAIYKVDDFKSLLKMCLRLSEIKFKGKSRVYYSSDSRLYYLVLDDMFSKELKYAFLQEYATYVKPNAFEYINEYCKCVVKKGAVKLLSALTN